LTAGIRHFVLAVSRVLRRRPDAAVRPTATAPAPGGGEGARGEMVRREPEALDAKGGEKSRRLESLMRLGQTLSATLSLETVLQRIVDAGLEIFRASAARLWLLEPDEQTLSLRAAAGFESPGSATSVRIGEGPVGAVAASRVPLTLPRVVAETSGQGLVSFHGAPLLHGDRLLGVLTIVARDRQDESREVLDVLRSLASHAAIAIDNARLFAEERTRREHFRTLLEINKTINSAVPTETLLSAIAEEAARLLGLDNAGFRLVDGDELVLAGLAGTAAETMVRARIGLRESLSGRVVTEGRAIIADIEREAPFILLPEHLAATRRLGYTSYLGVPLQVGARTIGIFSFRSRRAFTARDQEIAEAFAGQAALAIEQGRLYRDTQRQAERMAALAEVERLVADSLDAEVVAQRIVDSVCDLLGARSSALYRLDAQAGRLVALTIARETELTFEWTRVLPSDQGIAGLAVRERGPVLTEDALADPRIIYGPEVVARVERSTDRALLAVPLAVRESVFGVLAVGDHTGRRFTEEDVRLAAAFAVQAAIALENARLHEESEQRRRTAEHLADLGRLISQSLDPEEVGQRIVESVRALFGVMRCALYGTRPGTEGLVVFGSSNDASLDPAYGRDVVFEHGIGAAGLAMSERRLVMTPDLLNDPRITLTASLRAHFEASPPQAVLALPLVVGDVVTGVLVMADRAPRTFDDEEVRTFRTFGDQAAIALENARLYRRAREYGERLRALEEVNRLVSSSLQMEEVLQNVAAAVAQFFDAPYVSVWVFDPATRRLRKSLAHGNPQLGEGLPTELALGEGLVGWVVQHREPILWTDIVRDPRAFDAARVMAHGMRYFTAYPIAIGERVLGAFALNRVTPLPLTSEISALLGSLAAQAALALDHARLYAEAQERLRETTTLLAVGHVLSEPGPREEVLRRVAREVGRAFGADMVGAYVLDARRELLVPVAGYHVPENLREYFLIRPIVLDRLPGVRDLWRRGQSVWTSDALNDERFDPEWTAVMPQLSVLFTPTKVRGESVGGLFLVWWRTGREFPPGEVRLLEGVGAQVGLALENADLFRQTQAKLRETEALLSVSRALSTTLDLSALFRHFLRRVADTLDTDSVGVWLLGEDGEWLEAHTGYHVPPERLEGIRRLRLSIVKHDLYAEAVRTRRPVFSRDVAADPRVPAVVRELAPHQSQLFVPIVAHDRFIGGLIAVWWARERELSEGELDLMEVIANQAGIAIANARLFEENRRQVEELSVLHELSQAVTGQLDRAALIDALSTQVARVLDVRHMFVILVDEERNDLEVVFRIADGVPQPRLDRYPLRSAGLASVVLETGRPLRSDDYLTECARHGVEPIARSAAHRFWLGVPMTAGDQTLGVIALRSSERGFTASHERLLTNIGQLAALALRSARLFDERTRAYGELAAAQDQLVRIEKLRALGEMASGVAHDFNNLLAAILGRAQLLQRYVQDPKLAGWLQVIERSALDGAQTVRRLQEFSRVRRDQPMIPVDLNEVIREALEITQSRWREDALRQGVVIDVRTSTAPLPSVAGDAAELREALTNLILNAVDAMPQGGTLTVSSAVAGDGVELTVADTGVGIPVTVREKIFDPFFTTKGPQGTGLGLSMTYGILRRHGARIAVESEEGRGTTFRITFPRNAPVEPPAPLDAAEPPLVAGLRCLVVDDEEAVAAVLGDVLEANGHRVVVLTDGAEAIERVQREPFDLVFTDLTMPRVSGWEVAQAVKAAVPGVPVFIVTGFGVELSAAERRAHGVAGVISKPLRIEDITRAVAQVSRYTGPTGTAEEH
jgi:GAF domain-containing protein/ActR/RegA family two-component response regulator/anti-sigma regulatory factor (Ser/Thr protein kinase)